MIENEMQLSVFHTPYAFFLQSATVSSIHQLPHHLLTFEGQTALPIVRRLHLRFNREIKQENNRALLRF